MRGDGRGRDPAMGLPDAELWQRSRQTDRAEDEAERFLDLAAFADGRLDEDEEARVAEGLAADQAAASDVAAAQALAASAELPAPEAVVARASALGPPQPAAANILRFAPRRRGGPSLPLVARWAGMAAAIAVASWLGFTLGTDSWLSYSQPGAQNGEESFLTELFQPSTGFMHDLTEDAQT